MKLGDVASAEQLERLARLLPDGPMPTALSADVRYADESCDRAVKHLNFCRELRDEAIEAAVARIRRQWSESEIEEALSRLAAEGAHNG